MIGEHFYNETIRNTTAVFGSLFNNIIIKRKDGKIITVPIAYGPRSKWLEAHKAFDKDEESIEKMLPRISYEMVAMTYDTTRKITNKQKVIRTPDTFDRPRQSTSAPVPYILDYSVYIETKNLNDGWQIMEQILPFFTPSYTVRVRHFPADDTTDTPQPTNTYDMPVTLTAVSWTDDWTGDVGDRRTVEWNLEFSTKIWLYGPVITTSVILDSRAMLSAPGEGAGLDGLIRGDSDTRIEGIEAGYAILHPDSDTAVFDSDTVSPNIVNLFDSDGNVIKVVRDISTL